VGGEARQHLPGEHRGLEPEPAADPRQRVADEGREVLRAGSEGRQLDPRDGDAEVEVRPKAARPHLASEIPTRRRHHPSPHREGFAPTDPLEGALLEHVEQGGLEGQLQLADLVEEERSRPRTLESPHPPRQRAGEGAALVAEELALEQGARQRCEVRVDPGPPTPREAVEHPRSNSLPDPGLAGQENGGVERRQQDEVTPQRPRARALADQP
jgi:hypothetical protein